MLLTPHPLLVPQSWKSKAKPLPNLWTTTADVTALSNAKISFETVVDGWMSMEQWWNDTDRGKQVLGEKHYAAWVVDG